MKGLYRARIRARAGFSGGVAVVAVVAVVGIFSGSKCTSASSATSATAKWVFVRADARYASTARTRTRGPLEKLGYNAAMRFETLPSVGPRWACPAVRNWVKERAADNFRPDVLQHDPSTKPSGEVPAGSNSSDAILFPHLVRPKE